MQSAQRLTASGEVGGVIFGTPNGREVVAQTGISVPHNEDWVAEAAHALQFDLSTDTVVMQRFYSAGARVFWFGAFQRASEIDVSRGGYVGFGVWAVNCRVDGPSLLYALSRAARMVRDLAVKDGKFHSTIRAIANHFDGDPASYQAMLTTVKPLVNTPSIGAPGQQPVVLDMRGCSDAWCAKIIDVYQSDLGLHASRSIALARSDEVLESASRLRLWPVVSPIDWLTVSARVEADELRGHLQAAQGQLSQQQAQLNEVAGQLASANQQAQSLAMLRDQLSEAKEQVNLHRQEAQSAKSALDAYETKAQHEFRQHAQRAAQFESLANERGRRLAEVEAQGRHLTKQPTPGSSHNLAYELQRRLTKKEQLNRRLEDYLRDIRQQHLTLQSQHQELQRQLESRIEKESQTDTEDVENPAVARRPLILLGVATTGGWLLAFFLAFVYVFRGEDESTVKKLREFQNERWRYEQAAIESSSRVKKLQQQLESAKFSESQVTLELENLRAKLRAANTPKPKLPETSPKGSGPQTGQVHSGRPALKASQPTQRKGQGDTDAGGGTAQDLRD